MPKTYFLTMATYSDDTEKYYAWPSDFPDMGAEWVHEEIEENLKSLTYLGPIVVLDYDNLERGKVNA